MVLESFKRTAKFYSEQYNFATDSKNRVAFFVLEVDDSRSIFQQLEFQTVPRIFVLPAMESDAPRMKMRDYEADPTMLMQSKTDFLDFIDSKISVKVMSVR